MPQDFEFEVTITAVVTVRADDEASARRAVISSALAAPSADQIALANQSDFIMGKLGVVQSVGFAVHEDSVKLLNDNNK